MLWVGVHAISHKHTFIPTLLCSISRSVFLLLTTRRAMQTRFSRCSYMLNWIWGGRYFSSLFVCFTSTTFAPWDHFFILFLCTYLGDFVMNRSRFNRKPISLKLLYESLLQVKRYDSDKQRNFITFPYTALQVKWDKEEGNKPRFKRRLRHCRRLIGEVLAIYGHNLGDCILLTATRFFIFDGRPIGNTFYT